MPAPIVEALRGHRLRQLKERLQAGPLWEGNKWDLVFTSETGRPLHGTVVTHVFRRHLAKAGLPTKRFHDCRHAAASFAIAQGVDLRTLQEVLGHSSITTTANIYGHLQAEATRTATEQIGAAIAG